MSVHVCGKMWYNAVVYILYILYTHIMYIHLYYIYIYIYIYILYIYIYNTHTHTYTYTLVTSSAEIFTFERCILRQY